MKRNTEKISTPTQPHQRPPRVRVTISTQVSSSHDNAADRNPYPFPVRDRDHHTVPSHPDPYLSLCPHLYPDPYPSHVRVHVLALNHDHACPLLDPSPLSYWATAPNLWAMSTHWV